MCRLSLQEAPLIGLPVPAAVLAHIKALRSGGKLAMSFDHFAFYGGLDLDFILIWYLCFSII